ncbi:hypothetical protein AAVH_27110 [Aphelenchoides avenae]|nr:hypothetical protein AAVH_27110 [Aphelenchus avenae]
MDVENSLLKKDNVKASLTKNVNRLRKFAIRGVRSALDLLRLLLHHLLTFAGIVVIVTFSLAPTSGIYQVYREAHAKAADDARKVEKQRAEWTYHVVEWSYVCTTLDVEGQTVTYNLSCRSFAKESNTSLYENVRCETSIGTEPTNAGRIHMLQLENANCSKGIAKERSGCDDCPSPKGIEYRWDMAVFYVIVNLICVYHCVTAVCKFSYYRRLMQHHDGQSTHALRARILVRAWRIYSCVAFASISLELVIHFVDVDRLGLYGLPYTFCFLSPLWIYPSNFFVTDETKFLCGLPDSVFAGGQIDEAEVKRLRKAREDKKMQRRANCRLCER